MGAHSLLGRAEQVDRHEPLIERDVRVSKNRSHGYGELLTASAALPHAFANCLLGTRLRLKAISVIQFAAMRANRAFGPTLLFQKFAGFVGVAEVFRDVREVYIFAFHAPT